MKASIKKFVKWIGGERAEEAKEILEISGVICRTVERSEETEFLKLTCLAKYGTSIAFANYQKTLCDLYGFDFEHIIEWDINYNNNVDPRLKRPQIRQPNGKIGGHCVTQNTEHLNRQHPNPMLDEILRYKDGEKPNYKVWGTCNIYSTAKLGQGVNIGTFTEIGHNVKIGDRTRVGAMCFIPEGVTIEDECFIGPRVTFCNDKYPPSSKEAWEPIVVKERARIGAGATILPGVTIGKDSLIGAGSVVTKDVPEGEIWCGNPAKPKTLDRGGYLYDADTCRLTKTHE
jgi:acetyltransferase-like isoleucine patch superfamily enzyme